MIRTSTSSASRRKLFLLLSTSIVLIFSALNRNNFFWEIYLTAKYPLMAESAIREKEVLDNFSTFEQFTDFSLAVKQSFGLVNDVPSSTWKMMQQRVKEHENFKYPREPMKDSNQPRVWYQNNFEPDFTCQNERRIGGMGDGGKWVCNPHRIMEQVKVRKGENSNVSLIYSVGSNGNFRFEQGLVKVIGGLCEIHVFDFTDYSTKVPRTIANITHFHSWGFKGYNETSGRNEGDAVFLSLQEVIQRLGHQGHVIDVFKIDCEGCEWTTFQDWLKADVDIRQILVEVHSVPKQTVKFFTSLQESGYVIFHKEPNTLGCSGNCQEYAFVKLDQSFFE